MIYTLYNLRLSFLILSYVEKVVMLRFLRILVLILKY